MNFTKSILLWFGKIFNNKEDENYMDMNESTIIDELSSIKSHADGLVGKCFSFISSSSNNKIAYIQISAQTDEIIREFNFVVPSVNNLLNKIGINLKIENIKEIGQTLEDLSEGRFNSIDSKLTRLSLQCGRLLAILKNQAIASSENKNKFESLKEEIKELSKSTPPEVNKNLKQALEDFELNRLLGTTLICGRISIYLLDSISLDINKMKELRENQKSIMEERIKMVKSVGLLDLKGSEEMIMKANQKMRGLFAHDLNYFPEASEALAIFGDTINIVRLVTEYHRIKQQKAIEVQQKASE